MNSRQRRQILNQISEKLKGYKLVLDNHPPAGGWIYAIRTALNMSLPQLAERADKSAQGIKGLETREKTGAITIQSLREVAAALDMELVYAIVPRNKTLKQIVDEKAEEKAKEIVKRTSNTMTLEDQKLKEHKLMAFVMDKKEELKNEMPKFLWD
jgi:predicted DNA-binding mobile mystery protein A